MSETPKPAPPPPAIRITRPYATEDEYLEHELDMLTRTTVTLVGAQARPQGVVLRFELVLTSGHVVLRGEGRVLAFRPDALRGAGGLTLRFTRLDSRSKSLVDRAAALRDQRRPSLVPLAPPVPRGASILPEIPVTTMPPLVGIPMDDPPRRAGASESPEAMVSEPPRDFVSEPPPQVDVSGPLPQPPQVDVSGPLPRNERERDGGEAGDVVAPAGPARDELLGRLRARAKKLDPADVERILETKRRRA